jgi:hypothetical protein
VTTERPGRAPHIILATLDLTGNKLLRTRVLAALEEAARWAAARASRSAPPAIPVAGCPVCHHPGHDGTGRECGVRGCPCERESPAPPAPERAEIERLVGKYGAQERRWAAGDGDTFKPQRDAALVLLLAAFDRALADQDGLREALEEAAQDLVEAAWDGDAAPGGEAWWGVNDEHFQPLANALDALRALSTPAAPKKENDRDA